MIPYQLEKAVLDAMRAQDIKPPLQLKHQMDTHHRFDPRNGSTSRNNDAWYCFRINRSGKIFCSFGDWRSENGATTVYEDNKTQQRELSESELAERRRYQIQSAKIQKIKKQKGAKRLAMAHKSLHKIESHDYLTSKGFSKSQQKNIALYADQNNRLHIPIRDMRNNKLINYQIYTRKTPEFFSCKNAPMMYVVNKAKGNLPIGDNKLSFTHKYDKRFIKYCDKQYGFYYLDEKDNSGPIPPNPDIDNILAVTEGFATGLEIKTWIESPVIIGFDGDNIKSVVKEMIQTRKVRPQNILNCADNDRHNELTKPKHIGNKGKKIAGELKMFHGVDSIHPVFDDCYAPHISDFNDVRCVLGIEYVRENIFNQIDEMIRRRTPTRESLIEEVKEDEEEVSGSSSGSEEPSDNPVDEDTINKASSAPGASAYNYYESHMLER